MQKKLFEYVAFWEPSPEEEKMGKHAEIIVPPTTALSKDGPSAIIQAARRIPKKYPLDQITVAVRPF